MKAAAAPSTIRDERLLEIARIASDLGALGIEADAQATATRLDAGLFYVAVLGQFKRGKSTLINALAGRSLLPTGVAPVTSVVTVVRHGTKQLARARFRDGTVQTVPLDAIATFVSEAENPSNRKGVVAVEVEVPSSLLQHGLCLADTPGLGSINAANTAETREFMPHIDAALLVVGADPPITGEELSLLRDVAQHVGHVFVVLSKADRGSAEEIAEAQAFTTNAIEKVLPAASIRTFVVSAREVLGADLPTRDWTQMTRALEDLAQRDGADLVERARERELRGLRARLGAYLDEIEGALRRPLSETEQRVRALAEGARAAERAVAELRHLFDAEQQRIDRDFDDRIAAFIAETSPPVRDEIAGAMSADGHRGRGLQLAQEIVETRVRAWRHQMTPVAEASFASAARRFIDGALTIAAQMRDAGGTLDPAGLELDGRLNARSRFYVASLMTEATPAIGARLADRFRSGSARAASAVRAAQAFAERLLQVNANRVVNDFTDRMIESRRGIEAALRKQLNATATAAREAAARARLVQTTGADAVEGELHRLATLRARLDRA